jgi:hypothetical protein
MTFVKRHNSTRKLPVPATAVANKSPNPVTQPITASTEVDEAILYAQQVIAKLETAKVIAAETPEWQGDELVLEAYIRRINERVGKPPLPRKAFSWLTGLERVADSYKITESHH